ncbi:Endoribonuclease YbeY [Sesbania bispinosa]|nr:Endoribonuclease YbeY [Sesbania bispinosa]
MRKKGKDKEATTDWIVITIVWKFTKKRDYERECDCLIVSEIIERRACEKDRGRKRNHEGGKN